MYLVRQGRIALATAGETLVEGDVLHVVAHGRDMGELTGRLDKPLKDETGRG